MISNALKRSPSSTSMTMTVGLVSAALIFAVSLELHRTHRTSCRPGRAWKRWKRVEVAEDLSLISSYITVPPLRILPSPSEIE